MTTHESDHGDNQLSAIVLDRTVLAKFRTAIALDRTTLAWIRTTLTMATFGFGMIGYFRVVDLGARTQRSELLHQGAIKFGTALVILGLVATVLSGISHWLNLRRLRRNELVVIGQWPLSITVALLISILGWAALWSVFSR